MGLSDLHLLPDRNHPDDWRVEDTDADGDGACLVVIFSGHEAERRAREYFEWRMGSQGTISSPSPAGSASLAPAP